MTDEAHESDEALDEVLARARDAVAAPPPRLDDVTRRRLVARALAEAAPVRSARPPNRWPAVLAAAAAVAVVALGGWALASSGHDGGKADRASKAASSATTSAAPRAAFGDVSQPKQLLAHVRSALREQPGTTPTTGVPVAGARCAASVKTPAGVHVEPFATATYRGAPAVVFVARDGAEILIYVLDRSDCRLLTSQFFQG